MVSTRQLNDFAEKFLNETYGMSLTIPIKLNGRLKTSYGRFVSYRDPKLPKVIELNKSFLECNDLDTVLNVLKHELVHYALFMKGKPHSDGNPVFEKELKRLGIVSQSDIGKYNILQKMQIYQCKKCGNEYKMIRRLKNNGKYHICKCSGRLIDKGKRVVNV